MKTAGENFYGDEDPVASTPARPQARRCLVSGCRACLPWVGRAKIAIC